MLREQRRPGPADASAFIPALCRPQAYPHPADELELRETHISWVLLAGGYAYKIKKPVDFGFLDFSTLQLREDDCRRELELNRRLCADVYRGLSHVVERDAAFFMDGPGARVEPVVRMRRLPESGMLVQLLAEQAVSRSLMRRIAVRLARFHARAATGVGVDDYGRLEQVRQNWQENFDQMAPFVDRTITHTANAALRGYAEGYMAEHARLFRTRVAEGRIRDGHGDLHAASICLEGRRLWLFDCLEFSPRYRCADVAAEVAFLAMDLAHFGRADLAAPFVDAYVAASGDQQLARMLPFYACYRAYVRGKVRSLRLTEPHLTAAHASAVEEEARSYFDLAWSYAGRLAGPRLIAVVGLPASGKTTLARGLAAHLGLVHLNSDVIRKELAGLGPTEQAHDAFGEGLYTADMTRRTYARMRRRAARWLARQQSVVLDATFGDPHEREALVRVGRRLGVPLVLVECRADEAELRHRLATRQHDQHVVSDARPELWRQLRKGYSEPIEIAERVAVDTSTPLPAQVAAVLARLDAPT